MSSELLEVSGAVPAVFDGANSGDADEAMGLASRFKTKHVIIYNYKYKRIRTYIVYISQVFILEGRPAAEGCRR